MEKKKNRKKSYLRTVVMFSSVDVQMYKYPLACNKEFLGEY